MERRKHWWNGSSGGLGRLDVYLYEDAGHWLVEARDGGAEGRSRWYEFADEADALGCVGGLLAQPGQWREVT